MSEGAQPARDRARKGPTDGIGTTGRGKGARHARRHGDRWPRGHRPNRSARTGNRNRDRARTAWRVNPPRD